ncbi:hypothetical protein [Halospina sp. K52047b]|uniref:hypothetical protein n=1 Tax=Halospina sp. K52047b TaxID=2614160 RepID=UPI001249DA20|nr:hypothetical protein [Halospina sp. K52047b]KAA8983335.1 hypothetical protein F3089_04710 [Halospina sp. K52047b]
MKSIIRYSLFFACLYAGLAVAGAGHEDGHGHTHGADEPETEAFYGDESSGKDKAMEDHHNNMDDHHKDGEGHGEGHHGSHDGSDDKGEDHDHGGEHGHDH